MLHIENPTKAVGLRGGLPVSRKQMKNRCNYFNNDNKYIDSPTQGISYSEDVS